MPKKVDDSVLDAALDVIAGATEMYVCSGVGDVVDRADAIARSLTAVEALVPGDFTKANGDATGRKVTVAQQANISIDTTGTAEHVVLCTATLLLHVTTCTSQLLTSGGTVTVPAYDASEIEDPA